MSYHLGSIASSSCLRTSTLVVAGGSKVFGSHSCLFFSHLYFTLNDLTSVRVWNPRVHIDGTNIVIEVPIIAFLLLAALFNVTLMCCLQCAPRTAVQKDIVFVPRVISIVKMNHGTAVAFDFMKRSVSSVAFFLPAEPMSGRFVGLFGQRQSPSLVPFCVHFACALPVLRLWLRLWPRDTLGVGASSCVSIARGVATTQHLLGWGPGTLFKFVFFAVHLSRDSLCSDGVFLGTL